MKIKDELILGEIAGQYIVLPSGSDMDLSSMITLNDTAKFLWDQLLDDKTPEDLLQAVISTYENVDQEEARKFIDDFVGRLSEYDLLA